MTQETLTEEAPLVAQPSATPPTTHGRGSDWSASTLWTMRKARAVYAASRGKRAGFRAWWRTFCLPKMSVQADKLKRISATVFQMPASEVRKRAGL
jgi:hypothetical protein